MKIDITKSYIHSVTDGKQYGIEDDHYTVLLSHLSTYFNNSVILELGTLGGHSAVALAYNKSNLVYTYDKNHWDFTDRAFENFDNIRYIIGDCIESRWENTTISDKSISDREIILSSELIFLDVDPHDGIQEKIVSDFLLENNWKGIMVCDDIGTGIEKPNWHPEMKKWWQSVEVKKYNISESVYAAGTGTGIMCFGDQEIIS